MTENKPVEGVVLGRVIRYTGTPSGLMPMLRTDRGEFRTPVGSVWEASEVTDIQPLYTAPPQPTPITRELTDEEAERGARAYLEECHRDGDVSDLLTVVTRGVRAAVAAIGGVPSIPAPEPEPLPQVTREGTCLRAAAVGGAQAWTYADDIWTDDELSRSLSMWEGSLAQLKAVIAKREQERAEKAAQPDPAEVARALRDVANGEIGADEPQELIAALLDKGWTLTPPEVTA